MNNKEYAGNSGFKKLAVQWLIEHMCFVSSSVLADSFVLQNRQLLKPAVIRNQWAASQLQTFGILISTQIILIIHLTSEI
jgi:hypothetical protein